MKRTLAFCLILAFIVVGLPVLAQAPTARLGTRRPSTFANTSTTTTGPAWTFSASALTSGIGWQTTNAGSTVTGTVMDILSTGLTSGSALRIRLDNDNLTTGKYINCLGGASYDTAVFTIGEDGATTITSAVATTNSLSITNLVSTAGDLLTLTLDNDTADADTFYISCLGGTDHATSVFTLGENGVITFGDGGTIDGVTGTDVINITETNIGLTGATTVTGALTTTGTIGSAALKVPLIAAAVTDYDAQAATLTIAGLRGGFVTQNSKTGASTATTPTGTEISAGISGVAVGHSFSCVYYNRGDQTSTITAGASGVTVYGTAAIATKKTAVLYFLCTSANTWSCYVVAGA